MPAIYPFNAISYASSRDQSALIAPPYDVLDEAGKQRLLAKDPRNIVAIDLPHTPAKELGPPAAYIAAAERFRTFLADGTLTKSDTPVMFAYRQTWTQSDAARPGTSQTISRSGLVCCVDTVPFGPRPGGGGVLPHEETFSGPKADRLALMKATQAQLSPIFGLHEDECAMSIALLERVMNERPPDRIARTDDQTLHEVWTIKDEGMIGAFQAVLVSEDIFVADGHHRYNTALNYLNELAVSGTLPSDHPARRTMFVLIGMSDPGLVIWPTHRILGGMSNYTFDRFLAESKSHLNIRPVSGGPRELESALAASPNPSAFGLHDFATGRSALATPTSPDPLAAGFPEKAPAWRALTVAYIQHILVEQICEPRLNAGQPVRWAFPHTIPELIAIGSGEETGAGGGAAFPGGPQLAIIIRPTPLSAVSDVSRAGQLMPQKSTFFYPKLATGFFISPLE